MGMKRFMQKIEDLKIVIKKLDIVKKNPEQQDSWTQLALHNNNFQLKVLNVILGYLDRRFWQEY